MQGLNEAEGIISPWIAPLFFIKLDNIYIANVLNYMTSHDNIS